MREDSSTTGPCQVGATNVAGARVEAPINAVARTTTTNTHEADLHDLITAARADPDFLVSHAPSIETIAHGHDQLDERMEGWTKVVLHPGQTN